MQTLNSNELAEHWHQLFLSDSIGYSEDGLQNLRCITPAFGPLFFRNLYVVEGGSTEIQGRRFNSPNLPIISEDLIDAANSIGQLGSSSYVHNCNLSRIAFRGMKFRLGLHQRFSSNISKPPRKRMIIVEGKGVYLTSRRTSSLSKLAHVAMRSNASCIHKCL